MSAAHRRVVPGLETATAATYGPRVAPPAATAPESDREYLFEAFHQGAGTRGRGSGLGLAIAREAARLQGGDVSFRPRPGGGSIFVLRLPAEDIAGLS